MTVFVKRVLIDVIKLRVLRMKSSWIKMGPKFNVKFLLDKRRGNRPRNTGRRPWIEGGRDWT